MGIVNPELFNVFSGGMIRKMTLTVARGQMVLSGRTHPRNWVLKQVGDF
ncbi:hypothetical protein [Methanosarcina siciliae]|nr:hypothetical protein [Methanosarcina siciliae]